MWGKNKEFCDVLSFSASKAKFPSLVFGFLSFSIKSDDNDVAFLVV